MGVNFTGISGNSVGYKTATAGTPWYAVIPGASGLVTRLTSLQVNNGATPNRIYVMRALGYATVQSAVAASGTSIVLDRDPSASGNTIASGDQVLILSSDGTYRQVQVSSWSASTLTLTVGAVPVAISAGATLWNFGVYTDTEPTTSLAFPLIAPPTSAVTTYAFDSGFAGAASAPLLLYCPNATNQTILNYAGYATTAQ